MALGLAFFALAFGALMGAVFAVFGASLGRSLWALALVIVCVMGLLALYGAPLLLIGPLMISLAVILVMMLYGAGRLGLSAQGPVSRAMGEAQGASMAALAMVCGAGLVLWGGRAAPKMEVPAVDNPVVPDVAMMESFASGYWLGLILVGIAMATAAIGAPMYLRRPEDATRSDRTKLPELLDRRPEQWH